MELIDPVSVTIVPPRLILPSVDVKLPFWSAFTVPSFFGGKQRGIGTGREKSIAYDFVAAKGGFPGTLLGFESPSPTRQVPAFQGKIVKSSTFFSLM
jgi:hypothetical protein